MNFGDEQLSRKGFMFIRVNPTQPFLMTRRVTAAVSRFFRDPASKFQIFTFHDSIRRPTEHWRPNSSNAEWRTDSRWFEDARGEWLSSLKTREGKNLDRRVALDGGVVLVLFERQEDERVDDCIRHDLIHPQNNDDIRRDDVIP
jgi:hypothetical protein